MISIPSLAVLCTLLCVNLRTCDDLDSIFAIIFTPSILLIKRFVVHVFENPFIRRDALGVQQPSGEPHEKIYVKNKDDVKKLLQSGKPSENNLAFDMVRKPLYERHPMRQFSWTNAEETDMAEWYHACQDALNKLEQLSHGKDAAELIRNKVLQLLKGGSKDIKAFLEKDLRDGDFSNLNTECLSDIWIGKGRWAFVDLTAGPFSWGPSVGGEGVRIELSLPNVGKTIGAVAEISEDEAEDKLQAAIQEKFSIFGEVLLKGRTCSPTWIFN